MPRVTFRNKLDVSGGLVGHGYAVTHYVSPWASVSGATADTNDRGATAWTNATSALTPTTMGTAMARATAGNVVECAAGTYLGTATNTNWLPAWYPANNGTSGNPITIVAALPAATNPTSVSLSKLSNGSTADNAGAIYGSRGFAGALNTQDVIWDGFWVDQASGAFPQSSNGQAVLSGDCTRVYIRRGLFDRTTVNGGDNFAAIFAQQSVSCRISDCLFRGGTSFTGANSPSANDAAISLYGNNNILIENCQTGLNPNDSNRTVGCAIFIKGVIASRGNSGIIRYCRFTDGIKTGRGKGIAANAFEAAEGGMEIHRNVIQAGSWAFSIRNATDLAKTMTVHHNTFVDSLQSTSGEEAGVVVGQPVTNDSHVTFRDNIVAHLADTDLDHGLVLTVGFDPNQCAQWNYNCYHHAGASASFRDDPTNYTTLGGWQTLWTPAEANSIYSNPQFVDYAAGNFRLASAGQAALTASSTGGVVGAYVTGTETIGVRSSPAY